MHFKAIRKSIHYIENHEKEIPWNEAYKTIYRAAKYMRKKGDKIEIKFEGYYFLCEMKEGYLYVINAKKNY